MLATHAMAAEGASEAETTKEDIIAKNMPADGTTEMKFGVLIGLIEVGEIENRDIVDTVLDLVSSLCYSTIKLYY